MALQQFKDLLGIRSNLANQVGQGLIPQAAADAELNRVKELNLGEIGRFFNSQVQSGAISQLDADRQLGQLRNTPFDQFAQMTLPSAAIDIPDAPTPAPTLSPPPAVNPSPAPAIQTTQVAPPEAVSLDQYRQTIQSQVSQGLIPQAAADAELARVGGILEEGGSINASGQTLQGPSRPHNPELFNLLSGIGNNSQIQQAFQQALGLTGLGTPNVKPSSGFFQEGSLGRVDDQPSTETQAILSQLQGTPRGRDDIVPHQSSQQDLFNTFSKVSPDESAALQQRRNDVASAGNIDPNLTAALEQRRSQLDGLDSASLQGLRELGEQGIDRRQGQLLSQSRLGNIGAGRRGNVELAALPSIAREGLDAQRSLEKSLIETNLGERERQLQGFTGLAGQIDADRFNRQQTANQGFENAIGNVLNRAFGQGSSALQNLIGTNQEQQKIDQQALRDRITASSGFENQQFEKQKFNLDRLAAEKQGQLGLLFGLPSFIAQQVANDRAFALGGRELDILAAQLELETEQFEALLEALGGSTGGGSGGGSGGGNSPHYDSANGVWVWPDGTTQESPR